MVINTNKKCHHFLKLNLDNDQIKSMILKSFDETIETLLQHKKSGNHEMFNKMLHKLKGSTSFWGNDKIEKMAWVH